jgi:AcrR family transcriptional regulator
MGTEKDNGVNTELKIKEAARRVFIRKGFAATRTRDIAEEAGFNLALINYYFRSKEKLFDIIMIEQLQVFVSSVAGLLDDRETSLQQKIELIVHHYIDMLIAHPGLPIFILNEVNAGPEKLISKLDLDGKTGGLYLLQQWKEFVASGKGPAVNPIHIFMNLLSMTIFPFVAAPLIRNRTGQTPEEFNVLMEERKELIPVWVRQMLQTQ